MDSCWYLHFSDILNSAHFLFFILWPAATHECPFFHTYGILHFWLGSPSGMMAFLHSSSRAYIYFDFFHLQLFLSCCALPLPCVVCLHWHFRLWWLIWWCHPGFVLSWAANLNCTLLKLFWLCLLMSADPQLPYTSHILTGISGIIVLQFACLYYILCWSSILLWLHCIFLCTLGRPSSHFTSCF